MSDTPLNDAVDKVLDRVTGRMREPMIFALTEAEHRGQRVEREAVVKYLRQRRDDHPPDTKEWGCFESAAQMVERGGHQGLRPSTGVVYKNGEEVGTIKDGIIDPPVSVGPGDTITFTGTVVAFDLSGSGSYSLVSDVRPH